jgi:hypothetical protein
VEATDEEKEEEELVAGWPLGILGNDSVLCFFIAISAFIWDDFWIEILAFSVFRNWSRRRYFSNFPHNCYTVLFSVSMPCQTRVCRAGFRLSENL